MYWPGLNDQLEQLVLNCPLCLKYSTSKKKHDTHSALGREVPIFPWTKVATDIFHFEGNSYLLLVDYTSCFPIMRKPKSMTAQHIADHIKQLFAKYGWPDALVSDNGPCYASEIFKQLMKEYQTNHITSSPHYPQSNGLAEKYVQIIKNLFHKAKEEGQDLHKCLMTYRNTPPQAIYIHLCRSYQAEPPDPLCHYPMQQKSKWGYTVRSSEQNKRTNTSQHMICA